MVAQFLGSILDLEEDAPGPLKESRPRLREHGFAPESVKQLVADLLF